MGEPVEVAVEGRRVRLTNLDKVLYPAAGFTKAEVVDYYVRVADAMLPHLRDRPVVSQRWPDGITEFMWFQHRPPPRRRPPCSSASAPDRGRRAGSRSACR